jgi:Mn2+/Fe2+ NRAMP family transporter
MEPSKFFVYFGYAMAVFFALMGLYLIFLLPEEFRVPDKFRMMLGIIMVVYGTYRFISIRIKQRQHNDEENQRI